MNNVVISTVKGKRMVVAICSKIVNISAREAVAVVAEKVAPDDNDAATIAGLIIDNKFVMLLIISVVANITSGVIVITICIIDNIRIVERVFAL